MTAMTGATVLKNETAGAYRHLVLAVSEGSGAPGANNPAGVAGARPGQFAAVAVGEAPTAMLLRRAFSLYAADAEAGTIELVIAADGPGSSWLTRRLPGDRLAVTAPLGRPFPQPAPGAACLLVGGGYGSAPLLWWGRELAAAGHPVTLVLGAATVDRLFGTDQAVAAGLTVVVTTDDGSAGRRGRVTDALVDLLPDVTGAGATIYACGPMAMLRAVGEQAGAAGANVWLTVEEAMACGIGVCMTCVLPVRDSHGATAMRRSCVDGPTFEAAAIRWDAVRIDRHGARSQVPADCLGAPTGGH